MPADARSEFLPYALEMDATEMGWYVGDVLYAEQNAGFTDSAAYPALFERPFDILLKVAASGNFPGSPHAGTSFPITMELDRVRVYSGEPHCGPAWPIHSDSFRP